MKEAKAGGAGAAEKVGAAEEAGGNVLDEGEIDALVAVRICYLLKRSWERKRGMRRRGEGGDDGKGRERAWGGGGWKTGGGRAWLDLFYFECKAKLGFRGRIWFPRKRRGVFYTGYEGVVKRGSGGGWFSSV